MRMWNGKVRKQLTVFVLMLTLVMTSLTPLKRVDAASFSGYTAISSWEDLEDIVNDPTSKYYLTKDINMEGSGDWVPIENFTGILDGNGKTISNLHSTKGGLFASINGEKGARAAVRNLTLKDVDLQCATERCGAICNSAYMADITNCKVTGKIEMAGNYRATAKNISYYVFFGGLIGYGDTCTIQKCVNQANITGEILFDAYYEHYNGFYGFSSGGGIMGKAVNAEIIECCNVGEINIAVWHIRYSRSAANGTHYNYAYGNSNFGGIVGEIGGVKNSFKECFNIPVIKPTASDGGGPRDSDYHSIHNIGGLIGYAEEGSNVKLENSCFFGTELSCKQYTTSSTSQQTDYKYAVLGAIVSTANSSVQYSNVYYLKDEAISVNSGLAGVGDKESSSVKAFNTRGMQKQSNYKDWDFKNIWTISSDVNNGMPVLRCAASLFQLSVPSASKKSGTYSKGTKIELTAPAEEASIYYTIDGKTPTTKSTLYTGPITLDKEMKLRAIAVYGDFQASDVMKVDYKLKPSNEVALSREEASIPLDYMLKLKVLNLDSSKVSKQQWSVNRKTIATVSKDGVVTPVAVGKTTVKCTITYKDGSKVVLNCSITVTE